MTASQHAERETAFQHKFGYANIESISIDTNPLREVAALTSQRVIQRPYCAGMHKDATSADKVGVKETMCWTLLRACGNG